MYMNKFYVHCAEISLVCEAKFSLEASAKKHPTMIFERILVNMERLLILL